MSCSKTSHAGFRFASDLAAFVENGLTGMSTAADRPTEHEGLTAAGWYVHTEASPSPLRLSSSLTKGFLQPLRLHAAPDGTGAVRSSSSSMTGAGVEGFGVADTLNVPSLLVSAPNTSFATGLLSVCGGAAGAWASVFSAAGGFRTLTGAFGRAAVCLPA